MQAVGVVSNASIQDKEGEGAEGTEDVLQGQFGKVAMLLHVEMPQKVQLGREAHAAHRAPPRQHLPTVMQGEC